MKITILNKRDAKYYMPKGKAIIIRIGDELPMSRVNGEYIYKSIYFFFRYRWRF